MTDRIVPLSSRPAWKALQQHAETLRTQQLRDLFKSDPARGTRFNAEACGVFLDYSKNRITQETLTLLIQLATESGLKQHTEAMFTGEKSTPPKTAPFCTSLSVPRKQNPSKLTEKM